MELLLLVLMWMGIITQEQTHHISQPEANELFMIFSDQIEAEYPDEYQGIIGTYEDEVN